MKKEKGFTLIEILIVITIIGLLASVVLVGLSSFRSRGRDARRIADIRLVQNSLELYYVKSNNYPAVNNWDSLRTALIGAGIGVTAVPNDPLDPSQTYYYGYSDDTQGYVMGATLENENDPALKDDVDGLVYGVDCAHPVYCVQF